MSSNLTLPAYVLEAARLWRDGYEGLRERHNQGVPGKRIAVAFSDLLDQTLLAIYRGCLESEELGQGEDVSRKVTLVMHGGCGRREVSPHSDVDLLLLCHDEHDPVVEKLAKLLSQGVTDAGFRLGFSVQSPRSACSLAFAEPATFTSLIDSRFLAGSVELFDSFLLRLTRLATRRSSAIMRRIFQAREDERTQFGETVYLLRPNVKKSRGGLRDIHLVRWIGFVRYGEAEIDLLLREESIPKSDAQRLLKSNEFLLRVRNELHFEANRCNDVLSRNEQVRIAEKFGYSSRDEILAVEEFMRDYFRLTSDVRFCSDNFLQSSQPRPSIANMLAPIVRRNVDEHFRMGPFEVGVRPGAIEEVRENLESVLRLMQLANLHHKDIEPTTWEAIRNRMLELDQVKLDEDAAARFMALLTNPQGLGRSLRMLHEMRVLEKIIPGFKHARGLLQFNEYHQYTVDEHSILSVERATEFESDTGILGETYRAIREKEVLHLALLLHDIGKGYPEDHSEVGMRIARKVVKRLGLKSADGEAVVFLVHNHLMMSHLALHRDINDDSIVAEFASNVGSRSMLQMLFVLTCADIAAVGPDTLNQWKLGLLTDLYDNARNLLSVEGRANLQELEMNRISSEIQETYDDEITSLWLCDKVRMLPGQYLRHTPVEVFGEQLLTLRDLKKNEMACWSDYSDSLKISSICLGAQQRVRSGIFFKVTGLLSRLGLTVTSADIKHLGQSIVWYWLHYQDRDFEGRPPDSRLEDIRTRVLEAAQAPADQVPRFQNRWTKTEEGRAEQLSRPVIRVLIDNQSVEAATIIDVFAFQKIGLLYTISKKFYEMNLDINLARLSSYGQQVICVFYVTDENRDKIRDPERLDEIKRTILNSTRSFLRKRKPSSK